MRFRELTRLDWAFVITLTALSLFRGSVPEGYERTEILTLILLAISIALTVLSLLLRPSANNRDRPDRYNLDDFDVPVADEGVAIPDLYGTRLLRSPNCVWYGDLDTEKIEIKVGSGKSATTQLTGYAYFLGLIYALCSKADKVIAFYRDNERLKALDVTTSGTEVEVQTGKARELNGSGNEFGDIWFYLGDQDDTDITVDPSGLFYAAENTGVPIAYTDTCIAVHEGTFIGDDVNSVPQYGWVAVRTQLLDSTEARDPDYMTGPEEDAWETPVAADPEYATEGLPFFGGWAGGFEFWKTLSEINEDGSLDPPEDKYADANPAFVLYHILRTRLARDWTTIDIESFKRAARVLHESNMGISFTADVFTRADEVLEQIKRHIDAVLFDDATTGLTVLRLIREDYTVSSLKTLTQSDVKDLNLDAFTRAEAATELHVGWHSRKKWKTKTTTVSFEPQQDALGFYNGQRIDFDYITHPDALEDALSRAKPKYFLPPRKCTFKLSNAADPTNYLQPGDVVKLTIDDPKAPFQVTDLVLRVLDVGGEKPDSFEIQYEAAEDIFALAKVDGLVSEDPDPDYPTYDLDVPVRFPLVRDALQEAADATSSLVVAARPDTDSRVLGAKVFVGLPGGSLRQAGIIDFSWYGVLDAPYAASTPIDETGTLQVTKAGSIDFEPVVNSDGAWSRMATTMLIVWGPGDRDWELVSVKTIVDGGATWDCTFIIRELFHTMQGAPAPAGSAVYVLTDSPFDYPVANVAGLLTTGVSPGKSGDIRYRVRPFNELTQGPEIDIDRAYCYRPETPYGVQDLEAVVDGPNIVLTWVGKTRHGGAAQVNPNVFPQFWFGTERETRFRVEKTAPTPAQFIVDAETLTVPSEPGMNDFNVYARLDGRDSEEVATVSISI